MERRGEHKKIVQEVVVEQRRITMEGNAKGKKDMITRAACGTSTNRQFDVEIAK